MNPTVSATDLSRIERLAADLSAALARVKEIAGALRDETERAMWCLPIDATADDLERLLEQAERFAR